MLPASPLHCGPPWACEDPVAVLALSSLCGCVEDASVVSFSILMVQGYVVVALVQSCVAFESLVQSCVAGE